MVPILTIFGHYELKYIYQQDLSQIFLGLL